MTARKPCLMGLCLAPCHPSHVTLQLQSLRLHRSQLRVHALLHESLIPGPLYVSIDLQPGSNFGHASTSNHCALLRVMTLDPTPQLTTLLACPVLVDYIAEHKSLSALVGATEPMSGIASGAGSSMQCLSAF